MISLLNGTPDMKAVILALFVLSAGSAALAQSAGSTQGLTCGQAAGTVRARGAVVLHTGPTTYNRFVSGPGYCTHEETTEPAWVQTADSAQCFIGYRCRQSDLDNGR
jgi:hypothetical protein